MTQFEMMKKSQWYQVQFIQDKTAGYMQGWFRKGNTGFGAVLEDGSVVLWPGRGLSCDFKSVNEAKEYATCLTKSENQAALVIEAWNNIMW